MRWVLVAAPLLLGGCVERILTVRSQPPGAAVFLDGDRVGVTPCDVKYEFYGTRTVTLEKAGYASVTRNVELDAPWWQIFPFDLLTDVLLPFTFTDRLELSFLLQEQKAEAVDAEEMKRRAEELRQKARE